MAGRATPNYFVRRVTQLPVTELLFNDGDLMHKQSAAPWCDPGTAASASTASFDNSGNLREHKVFNAAEYRQRARQFAPTTTAEIVTAAVALSAQGYGAHSIAQILEVEIIAARQIIGAPIAAAAR